MEVWQALVYILVGVEGKHPKKAYVGLNKYLQQEWDFVQHVTPGIGQELQLVEDELRDDFLPVLFKGPHPISMVERSTV